MHSRSRGSTVQGGRPWHEEGYGRLLMNKCCRGNAAALRRFAQPNRTGPASAPEPHLEGRIQVDPPRGLLERSVCLSRFTPRPPHVGDCMLLPALPIRASGAIYFLWSAAGA